MSKTFKVLISLFLIISVLIGASLYFISSKINPSTIKKVAIQAIEENLNNVKADIQMVDYKLGTSLKVEVKKLQITNKLDRSKLLELESVEVKVPILAILTSGGTIDIVTNKPKLYLIKKGENINWTQAVQKKESPKKIQPTLQKKSESSDIEIPEFVNKSKLNLKVLDAEFLLNLGKNQKSKITLNKIILKNLNFVKTTAFEISSLINYQLDKNSFFKTNIQAIGEIDLNKLIKNKSIETSTQLKIQNTSIDGMSISLPLFKGNIKTKGSTEKLMLDFSGELESVLELKMNIGYQKSSVNVTELDISIDPKKTISSFTPDLINSLKLVDFNDTRFKLRGDIALNLSPLKINPQLSFTTTKKIEASYVPQATILTGISGKVVGKEIVVKADSETLSGIVQTKIKTEFDPLNIPSEVTKFSPISIDLGINGLKISKSMIQNNLWKNTKSASPEQSSKTSISEDADPGNIVQFPPVDVSITGDKIYIADQMIKTNGTVTVRNNTIKANDLIFQYGKGKLKKSFETKIKTTKNIKTNFDLKFDNVEVSAFNAFFPPYLNDLKGKFIGKVNGNVLLANKVEYSISSKLQGRNGELKNLNIAAIINPILNDVSLLKGKLPKKQNISNKFDKLYSDINLDNRAIKVNRLEVNGHKKTFELITFGKVSMSENNSILTGTIYLQQNAKQLKKITGQSKIPFRLKGKGFAIYNPDLKYTTTELTKFTQKLLKKKAKSQLRKEKKKIQSKIKKEKKKIKKKVDKEIKNQKKKLEDELKKKLKGIKF